MECLAAGVQETVFASDSTGFSGCKFDLWYDAKYRRMHQEHT
jgi:hypothetical protein